MATDSTARCIELKAVANVTVAISALRQEWERGLPDADSRTFVQNGKLMRDTTVFSYDPDAEGSSRVVRDLTNEEKEVVAAFKLLASQLK